MYKRSIEVMDFTFTQYEYCNMYKVHECADSHKDCKDSLKTIADRMAYNTVNFRDCV